MIAIAHILAIACYGGAAALAATPFVRPVAAPVRGVVTLLVAGVTAHAVALAWLGVAIGQLPVTGLGPSLSFAGFTVALTLLLAEVGAREVTLTLAAGPLAAVATAVGLAVGLAPGIASPGARGAWLVSHIALSFGGIAAYAAAAAAGAMYLVESRELKSRRFGAVWRFFPPLETLDRVNHVAAIAGWLALTVGIVLAATYAVAYRTVAVTQLVWGLGAWGCASALAAGRLVRGWRARRAALVSTATFALVVAVYVVVRLSVAGGGRFL